MREQGYILPKTYRKLGLGFFVLSILTTIFISYLVWAKVVIIIHPSAEKINHEFIFDIKEGANLEVSAQNNVVPGKVKAVEVQGQHNFTSTGSKVLDTNIVGEVVIVNNYSKEQTLISSTRLAYADKPEVIVVRLNSTVVVPPGGEVKVQVYPENEEAFKDVDPGQLIIPGLWGPLQDKIFARVDKKLSQGSFTALVATEEDLQKSQTTLRDQLYQQALSDVNSQLETQETLWPKLVAPDVSDVSHSAKAGDEVSEFSTTMKLKVIVVVFDESQVVSLAKEKIKEILPNEKQLVNLDPKTIIYSVEKYDLVNGQANVKATISASSILAGTSGLLDKSNITGMTEEEVKSYFSQFSEVSFVDVDFHPSWLRKTPRLQDKIEIRISE